MARADILFGHMPLRQDVADAAEVDDGRRSHDKMVGKTQRVARILRTSAPQGAGLGKRLLKYALIASKGRDIILILYHPHHHIASR